MPPSDVVYSALIDIRTQQTQLKADLDLASKTLSSSLLSMQSIANKLAPVLGIGGLVAYGKSVIDLAGHIQNLSEQTGLSGQTLSGLKSTLEQSGTSLDAFAKGIFTAQKNLGMVNDATDPAAQAIKILGLNLNELRNASPERFLELIANALGKIENPVERATRGAQLLGKSFQELAPALAKVAGHLNELRQSGMSNDDIKRLSDFNDAATNFKNTIMILASGPLAAVVTLLQQLRGTLSEKDNLLVALNDVSEQSLRLAPQIKAAEDLRSRGVRAGIASDAVYNKMLQTRNELLQKSSDLTTKLNQLGSKKTGITPFTPLPGKKEVDPRDAQLLKEGIKDVSAAIDELQNAAIKGGQAIIDLSESLDREGLTPLDQKLAEINKKFDEMRQKVAEAAEATGQDLSGFNNRIEFFRRQAALLASQPTSVLDIADAAEGERLRNQREEFIKLGQAAFEFQEHMREIATLSKVFGTSFDAVGASISAVRAEIERLIATGLDPLDPRITALKKQFDDLQSVARAADEAESFIRGAFGGITGSLQGVILGTQSVSQAFRNMAQNILLSIADVTVKLLILEPLIKSVRQAITGGGGIGGFLSGLLGGGSNTPIPAPELTVPVAFPEIPWLQGGGIIRRQTLAMVHPDEAVIPLPRKDILDKGNGGVQVIIRGGIVPERPSLGPKDVVQVMMNDFDNRGPATQLLEQRMSPRR